MPREQLQLLAADVERLLAAGAAVAAGDEGLERRSKALRELGQKVPVLLQIADAVDRTVNAPAKQVTPALLDLLLIVRQVRANLSSASVSGEAKAIAPSGPWTSTAPMRELESWIDALTSSGSGRTKVLKKALARDDFTDLRMVDPLMKALGSTHFGLARLVAEKALPAFGRKVLPELQEHFDLTTGKAAEARCLQAICVIDPAKGADLCRRGLTEGSTPVKLQSLRSLSRLAPEETEKAALTLLASKASPEVNCAAYFALATAKSDEALEALLAAFLSKKDTYLFETENSLGKLQHPQATPRLLEALTKALDEVETRRAQKGKKPPAKKGKPAPKATAAAKRKEEQLLQEAIDLTTRLIGVLGERKDAKAIGALLPLLQHPVLDIRGAAAGALVHSADRKALHALLELLDDPNLRRFGVQAGWQLPGKERFEKLAPLLDMLTAAKPSQRQPGDLVLEQFCHAFWAVAQERHEDEESEQQDNEFEDEDDDEDEFGSYGMDEEVAKPPTDWDPRWAPALRKHLKGKSGESVAQALAIVIGEKVVPELLPLLAASVSKRESGLVFVLGHFQPRSAAPDLAGLINVKNAPYYVIAQTLRRIGDLSVLPQLEEQAKKTKEVHRKRIIEELIEFLENKQRQASATR
jgi:HEAT repeat protein